jgi:hypothetical protein
LFKFNFLIFTGKRYRSVVEVERALGLRAPKIRKTRIVVKKMKEPEDEYEIELAPDPNYHPTQFRWSQWIHTQKYKGDDDGELNVAR